MKYTFKSRVRYSEIDYKGELTLPGLINYFQDCSTFQSEELGLGLETLKEKNRAWLLSYWQVVVDRYPKMGEEITTGTFAYDFRGLFGERNFFMQDEEGKQIACANSLWVYIDTEKGRPVAPDKEAVERYGKEERLDMEYEGRKIKPSECTVDKPSFPVRRYHIDTNGHVNNCQYVQMAMEMIPQEKIIRQVRVGYTKSAVLGDIIYPKYAEEEERTVVELCDANGGIYAIIEIK